MKFRVTLFWISIPSFVHDSFAWQTRLHKTFPIIRFHILMTVHRSFHSFASLICILLSGCFPYSVSMLQILYSVLVPVWKMLVEYNRGCGLLLAVRSLGDGLFTARRATPRFSIFLSIPKSYHWPCTPQSGEVPSAASQSYSEFVTRGFGAHDGDFRCGFVALGVLVVCGHFGIQFLIRMV